MNSRIRLRAGKQPRRPRLWGWKSADRRRSHPL